LGGFARTDCAFSLFRAWRMLSAELAYKVLKVSLPWPQIPGTDLEEVDKGFVMTLPRPINFL
jgi:hypothetical protein